MSLALCSRGGKRAASAPAISSTSKGNSSNYLSRIPHRLPLMSRPSEIGPRSSQATGEAGTASVGVTLASVVRDREGERWDYGSAPSHAHSQARRRPGAGPFPAPLALRVTRYFISFFREKGGALQFSLDILTLMMCAFAVTALRRGVRARTCGELRVHYGGRA